MPQATTITFFRYDGLKKKFWGLQMMGKAHASLSGVNGQQFYRLLGSGRGMGFHPLPDWSVYALLQVWDDELSARAYHHSHPLADEFRANAAEYWTVYMKNIRSGGEWGGQNPFHADPAASAGNSPVAVITRATIKKRYLARFWTYVPAAQRPLSEARGLLFSKGIGEVPLAQMATFSIWKNEEAMKSYAYGNQNHRKAIDLTRSLGWYREELFSRFAPVESEGSWMGKDPLKELTGPPSSEGHG